MFVFQELQEPNIIVPYLLGLAVGLMCNFFIKRNTSLKQCACCNNQVQQLYILKINAVETLKPRTKKVNYWGKKRYLISFEGHPKTAIIFRDDLQQFLYIRFWDFFIGYFVPKRICFGCLNSVITKLVYLNGGDFILKDLLWRYNVKRVI